MGILKEKLEKILAVIQSFDKKKVLLWVSIGVVAIIAVVGIFNLVKKSGSSNSNKIQVKGAKASQQINKEFSFPLKDAKGAEVSKIKFVVENAELRDEIIVKGQRATSVSGRAFLILNLKISNEHNQAIEINTRDYVRLIKNGNNNELLAPDIHNDPVEIQAISTKYTRVGFAINDSDQNIILRIGEINGEKQEIAISFK